MYETSFQVAALKARGFAGLRDLNGRRVGVGPAGGPAEVYFRAAAEVAGVAPTVVNGSPADQSRQLLPARSTRCGKARSCRSRR